MELQWNLKFNPLVPVSTKRSHILKQTCSFQLYVWPFSGHQALKGSEKESFEKGKIPIKFGHETIYTLSQVDGQVNSLNM